MLWLLPVSDSVEVQNDFNAEKSQHLATTLALEGIWKMLSWGEGSCLSEKEKNVVLLGAVLVSLYKWFITASATLLYAFKSGLLTVFKT